jgi:transposase
VWDRHRSAGFCSGCGYLRHRSGIPTALLDAHWPGPKALFYRLGSEIALAFLTDYPTPESATRLGAARLAAFLRRHAYRGGKTPTELLDRLRSAPTPPTGLPPQVLTRLLTAQIQLLRTLLDTITQLEAEIKRTTHPRTRLIQQLPGIGQINLAQILAEIGPILDRVEDAEQAAAECCATPITKASGKTTGVYFRWAANTRARKAITAFAHNSRRQSPWAQGLYHDARARGKRNPHATRIVARSWIRVIWACWHTNTPYDPLKHTAEQRAATLT